MAAVDYHIREQLAATKALIKFLQDHGGHGISEALLSCREALEQGDVASALKYAYGVKPFGMGGITDSNPSTNSEDETAEYVRVLQDALVRNWMFWMSAADHESFPFARDLIRSVGRFFRS